MSIPSGGDVTGGALVGDQGGGESGDGIDVDAAQPANEH
jgi:hypothetical protein